MYPFRLFAGLILTFVHMASFTLAAEIFHAAQSQFAANTDCRVWQQGADVWAASLGATPDPRLFAPKASFPTLIALSGSNHVFFAFENGPCVEVERR